MIKKYTKEETLELKEWASRHILEIFQTLGYKPDDRGRYLTGCCPVPFHPGNADNDRAFAWSYDKAKWRCYTHQCDQETSSDIFGFVQAMKECPFPSAVRFLDNLKKNGFDKSITVTTKQVIKREAKSIKIDKHKLDILMKDFYFKGRGIDEFILSKHKVGYWQKEGTFMHKRAIVPVFDIDNNLVGFSGRSLLDKKELDELGISKWIHALDFVVVKSPPFDKSSILYNLNNCKEIVRQTKTIYVVEGPIDCWKLEMAGISNVVATLGLYITPQQMNLLVQLGVEKVIVCYDNDKETGSGLKAARIIQEQLGSLFIVEIKIPTGSKDYGEMNVAEIKEALNVS